MLRFELIGNPVKHSLSPILHQAWGKHYGKELEYTCTETTHNAFERTVMDFFTGGGHGLNITVPFKETAYQITHQATLEAQRAKVANTLRINPYTKLLEAHNTDGIGFLEDISHHDAFHIEGKTILILGAGGAAAAILPNILHQRPAQVTISNRTTERAEALVKRNRPFLIPIRSMTWGSLKNLESVDLIIHTTSMGHTQDELSLPSRLAKIAACYDLSYGAANQPFQRWAIKHNAPIYRDGLGMLVAQAAESFHFWHNILPDIEVSLKWLKQQNLP